MRFRPLFPFLLLVCPATLSAQSITSVLDGRAEISVPDGYRRLPAQRAVGLFKDLFYIGGRRAALESTVSNFDPDSISFPMAVEEDARAHFAFIEIPLTADNHPLASDDALGLADTYQDAFSRSI